MSSIDQKRYTSLARSLFERIDQLRGMGFQLGDLSTIREAVGRGEPLHEEEEARWRDVYDFVLKVSPDHQRLGFVTFASEYRRLKSLPRSEKTAVSIVSYDAVGNQSVSGSRVRIATQITPIDPFAVDDAHAEETEAFMKFRHAGRLWMLMDPAIDSRSAYAFARSVQSVLPVGTEGEFTLVGQLHTTALLYKALKKRGLYAGAFGEDVTIEGVRLVGNVVPESWPKYLRRNMIFPALSMSDAMSPGWERLVAFGESDESDDEIAVFLSEALRTYVAPRILKNLKCLAESLKQMGIAMNSWEHLRVNMDTGEVRLGEEDRPVLLDADYFQNVVGKGLPTVVTPHFFPNLLTYATGDDDIINGERELKLIMDLMSEVGFSSFARASWRSIDADMRGALDISQVGLYNDRDGFIEAALSELEHFACFTCDEDLASAILGHRGSLVRIIDHYFRSMDETGNGIYIFFTDVLPQIVSLFEPEDYVEVAEAYIDAGHTWLMNQFDMEIFWRETAMRLRNLDFTKPGKKGGGGVPPGSMPGGGFGGIIGGFGGGEIGQARGALNPADEGPRVFTATSMAQAGGALFAPALTCAAPLIA